MSRNVTITYELNLPKEVEADGLARNRTLSLPLPQAAGERSGNKQYYDSLRTAILQAKDEIGEELTTWRDAVGNIEQAKEPKVARAEEDEEDGEEAEGEE